MPLENYFTPVSILITFTGLLFVAYQIRQSIRQRESDAQDKLFDINRELMSLGFAHPKLFEILEDTKNADPLWEQRYLQLWLNQLSISHSYMQRSVREVELKESFERNLMDFMTMRNMQRHWKKYGSFYPVSFQKRVNDIMKKLEPPHKPDVAAQPKSGR